jgi:NAD(P)-dependent dehydrogenase (short-subunit alcohol dehydrogenase family)
VAACDWNAVAAADAVGAAQAGALDGVLVSSHACDVADETQVQRFRDELVCRHAADHVDLVFNNAGIGGGASFVKSTREEWEPQVRVAVVMPGHVGTDIIADTRRAHGEAEPQEVTDAELAERIPPEARADLVRAGLLTAGASANAAAIILDGVRSGAWRILVGKGARTLDMVIRANPEAAYDYAELAKPRSNRPAARTRKTHQIELSPLRLRAMSWCRSATTSRCDSGYV